MRVPLIVLGALIAGCGRTPVRQLEPVDAGDDADAEPPPEPIDESDKLDVLFVIDNTTTGGFAHDLLARTIPYFMDRLTTPRCINGLGQVVSETASPNDSCPVGVRNFAPVFDVRLAVISTSIGGHGADTCSPDGPNWDPEQNDAAHLLSRSPTGGAVPSYGGDGFLQWDPLGAHNPPGDSDLGELDAKAAEIVRGVGRNGCGFEAPLEAMRRFLVDPDPYESIEVVDGAANLVGTDELVLQQRHAFLRSDSALLIVLVTDEDDCSTREGGNYFFSNQNLVADAFYHLPRARSACAQNPEDPCCVSCGQAAPSGCPAQDPACSDPAFDEIEDPINLRCFDQKRRFGIDFLFPLDRYESALTDLQIEDRNGDVQRNPLFVDNRSERLVLLAGIVGVPWQDLALNPSGPGGGFVASHDLPWELVLGDAATGTLPEDPLMIPSRTARSGVNPVDGSPLAPPDSTSPDANPINGHEHALATELQYACVYPIAEPEDCSTSTCECSGDDITTNPICQDESGNYDTLQRLGRATPSTRQLGLLRALQTRSLVASICAGSAGVETDPGFGYVPAVDGMMRLLRGVMKQPPEPEPQTDQ